MHISERFEHVSVLLEESLKSLNIKPDGVYMDGTVGGAGHSSEILRALGECGQLIALDKDQDALDTAQERLKKVDSSANFNLAHANFADFASVLISAGVDGLDGVLLDLGVSSWQIDEADRGFSYMKDGPLDMRMDRSKGESAAELIARIDSTELADIFFKYGEERNSYRIANSIVNYRDNVGPITTTKQLSDIITKAQTSKSRREKQHPAKRCFQALRIYVNGEMQDLDKFLSEILDYMNPGGRVCIISFHSLEDRLVKQSFRKWEDPCICPPNFPCTCGKKPLGRAYPRNGIVADDEEKAINPRSKSARLRVFEKF